MRACRSGLIANTQKKMKTHVKDIEDRRSKVRRLPWKFPTRTFESISSSFPFASSGGCLCVACR